MPRCRQREHQSRPREPAARGSPSAAALQPWARHHHRPRARRQVPPPWKSHASPVCLHYLQVSDFVNEFTKILRRVAKGRGERVRRRTIRGYTFDAAMMMPDPITTPLPMWAPPCRNLGRQCQSLPVTLRVGSLEEGTTSLDHEATWLLGHTARISFGQLWEEDGDLYVDAVLH